MDSLLSTGVRYLWMMSIWFDPKKSAILAISCVLTQMFPDWPLQQKPAQARQAAGSKE
jgi:hypothetical protein